MYRDHNFKDAFYLDDDYYYYSLTKEGPRVAYLTLGSEGTSQHLRYQHYKVG